MYVWALSVFWQIVSADESYVDGQRKYKAGKQEIGLSYANKSINKNPHEPRYYYGRARIYLALTTNQNKESAEALKKLALNDLQKATKLNPNNLVTLRNVVPLYYFLAIKDYTLTSTNNNIDQEYIQITINYFQHLKNTYPKDVGVVTLVAKYEKKLNLNQEYKQSLEMIENLRPDLVQWHPSLIQ